MNKTCAMVLVLMLCISMVGCGVLRGELESRPMTVEEQIRAAEIGLAFAQMAYAAYLDHRDEASAEDAEQGRDLFRNIAEYIELIQELRGVLDKGEPRSIE